MSFKLKERVRLKTPKPLPSGKSIKLVALVDYFRPDGVIEIRVCTPGLYGGAILKVAAEDLEAI